MITNFINDNYLKTFYPDISKNRDSGLLDYSTIISTAYKTVIQDVNNAGINPRLCHTPIDLNQGSNDTSYQYLKEKTISTDTVNEAVHAMVDNREGRYYIYLSSQPANDVVFRLQGSNEHNTPLSESAYWETIKYLAWTNVSEAGYNTIEFTDKYKWYRLTINTSETIKFRAGLYETIWDNIIAHKALQIIYQGWTKEEGDTWDVRRRLAQETYDTLIQTAKINYDTDGSGTGQDEIEIKQYMMTR